MTKREEQRILRLFPNGIPRYIRCYDNQGKTADRYTVVFTGNYKKTDRWFDDVIMSGAPFHPQGICMHGQTQYQPCDRPTYSHLGKKIKFSDLPEDCQTVIMRDYVLTWEIDEKFELKKFLEEHFTSVRK